MEEDEEDEDESDDDLAAVFTGVDDGGGGWSDIGCCSCGNPLLVVAVVVVLFATIAPPLAADISLDWVKSSYPHTTCRKLVGPEISFLPMCLNPLLDVDLRVDDEFRVSGGCDDAAIGVCWSIISSFNVNFDDLIYNNIDSNTKQLVFFF